MTTPVSHRRRTAAAPTAPTVTEPEAIDTNSVDSEPGEALLVEAEEQLAIREWKGALRTLEAARRLRPDDRRVDQLTAVAAAYGKNADARDEAIRLLTGAGRTADGWTAVASSQLATGDFLAADRSARSALDLDRNSVGAWRAMAASYAGLGWFDEADRCLDAAEASARRQGEPAEELAPLERWQLGRAINTWAMTNQRTLLLAVVAVLVFRLLGAALVVSAPLVLREYRVARLDPRFRDAADEAWRHDHRPRIYRGLIVLTIVLSWLGLVALAT